MSGPGRLCRDWGGAGPMLHLAHGNGFPPGTYRQLAEDLRPDWHPVALCTPPLRPGCSPAAMRSWRDLAVDLEDGLRALEAGPVVGLGHSVGAVATLLVAARSPELFRALVLVDPVLFTGPRARLWGVMKTLGLGHRFHLARAAAGRREVWEGRAQVHEAYAGKPLFAVWAPDVLDDYLDAGLVTDENGGVRLRYPTAWEERIFVTTPHDVWSEVRRLAVPTLVVRGAASDTFTPQAAARLTRELPAATMVEVPGTSHLLPMERPHDVAEVARRFLAGHSAGS